MVLELWDGYKALGGWVSKDSSAPDMLISFDICESGGHRGELTLIDFIYRIVRAS